MTMKDSDAVAGMRSTIGVRGVGDRVPVRDGTVAARLGAAGAIVIGMYDIQTDSELFGRTNNPWDPRRTAGGSSGAGAVEASGLSPVEVGSDLGGSVRIPAALCRVVGFKPTEGRIPETGHIDIGRPRSHWIMESIGPLARTVRDARLLYSILAGPDGIDPTVPPVPVVTEAAISPLGMGPIVGRSVSELIVDGGSSLDLGAFRLSRFADGSFNKPRLVT
jgi:amidase